MATTHAKTHRSATERATERVTLTRSLALVAPAGNNPFFQEVAQGLEQVAWRAGFGVFSCNTDGDPVREEAYLELLVQTGVEGVALVPAGSVQPALNRLRALGLATVVIDRDIPGAAVDCVYCDNEEGAFEAVSHLLALGHRRIGCVTGNSRYVTSAARLSGYHAALRHAGLQIDPALIVPGNFSDTGGYAAARRLLEAAHPPTAIFACNDLMALGVLHAARTMGIELPNELSVVGFDDIHMAELAVPALTTMVQPKAELGRQAAAMLLERLADPALPYRRAMLPARLCLRASTTTPA